jgi:hypothetical protein
VNPFHDSRQLAELVGQIASHVFKPDLGICRKDEHDEGIAYAVGEVEPAELPLRLRSNQCISELAPCLDEAAHAARSNIGAEGFQPRHHRSEPFDVCIEHR